MPSVEALNKISKKKTKDFTANKTESDHVYIMAIMSNADGGTPVGNISAGLVDGVEP